MTDPTAAGAPISEVFHDLRRSLTGFLDSQLAPMGDLARAVGELADRAGVPLSEADLEPLRGTIVDALEASSFYVGHGYVAAPGAVHRRDRFLFWFQRRATGTSRLVLNLDPDDPDLYDYLDMEWYTRACERRAPSIYGPYLDYTGSDLLVLTAAVPVLTSSGVVGVAGADLQADLVERQLATLLRGAATEAVVVNDDRAVVATNSPRWLPGERLATHPTTAPDAYGAVGSLGDWTGWVLAVAPRD